MASIQDFKTQMFYGGARSNQFRVHLSFPTWVDGDLLQAQRATFLCKAAQLPASTIADIEVQYRGRAVHFAGERSYQPWVITIINDGTFGIRNAFEDWHNGIQNYNKTGGMLTPANYQRQMTVYQLDRNDAEEKNYQFINAYPTTIGPIQLSYDQPNEIEQFEVEFAYDYFIPSSAGIDGQPAFKLNTSVTLPVIGTVVV